MCDDGQFWQRFDLDVPLTCGGVSLNRAHHPQRMDSGAWQRLFGGSGCLGAAGFGPAGPGGGRQ